MNELEPASLTDEQRAKLVEKIQADPWTGHVKAARAVGIPGSAGQIRQMLAADNDFQDALREARGEVLDKVGLSTQTLLQKLAWIVQDDGNSSQLRAIQQGLRLRGIDADETVTVNHTGEVHNPDVAAAIDRFTALTAAAVRAASRDRAEPPALEP